MMVGVFYKRIPHHVKGIKISLFSVIFRVSAHSFLRPIPTTEDSMLSPSPDL